MDSTAVSGDVASPLLLDATIEAKITAFGYLEALAQCAEALASQFARQPDEYNESTGIRLRWSSRVATWQKLAIDARAGIIADPSATTGQAAGILSTTLDQARTFTRSKYTTDGTLTGDVGSMEVW